MSTTVHIVGITHIDLAWLGDSSHYQQCQEGMLIRLLDLLEQDPGFTYVIEQIAHYRWLQARRPDLIARLRPYVECGRVEIGGGMASALDTNGPNGECLVRNHLLGRRWVAEHLGGDVVVGELLDTFGISAQTPQVHRLLGMPYLLANRLGGAASESLFHCRALDGSTVLMAGPDCHHPCQRHPQTHFRYLDGSSRACDLILAQAANASAGEAAGRPVLAVVYDENEHLPTDRVRHHLRQGEADGTVCRRSTLRAFFRDLEGGGLAIPTCDGDLNPCFSACYALQPWVRLRNRRIETALLEAEKWAALRGRRIPTEEAWWHLAAIQSHDIYSGSFPTQQVLPEVEAWLDASAAIAEAGLHASLGAASGDGALHVSNGLPWRRCDECIIPLPAGWQGARVSQDGLERPCRLVEGGIRCLAEAPACGSAELTLLPGAPPPTVVEDSPASAIIANEFIRLRASSVAGIASIEHIPSGRVLAEGCGGLLEAQRDDGTHQREEPADIAIPAHQGRMRLVRIERDACGERLILAGEFPDLAWCGPESLLRWEIELGLRPGRPQIDCRIRLEWRGKGTAVRLHLPTCIDSVEGLYEIPFGCVRRRPHGVRSTARGEDWPVHRFVMLADGGQGIGLVNTGCMGASTVGGSIRSTLFRAPAQPSHGVLAVDERSCCHGEHTFGFAIVPFVGAWQDSPVLEVAQSCNNPLLVRWGGTALPSQLTLAPAACVLSAVKAPEDGTDDLIVRFYETAGLAQQARLAMPGLQAVRRADLLELPGEDLPVIDGSCTVSVRPFEIITLRARRRG